MICGPERESRAGWMGHDPTLRKEGNGRATVLAQQAVVGLGDDPHISIMIHSSSHSPSVKRFHRSCEPSQAMGAICENRRG